MRLNGMCRPAEEHVIVRVNGINRSGEKSVIRRVNGMNRSGEKRVIRRVNGRNRARNERHRWHYVGLSSSVCSSRCRQSLRLHSHSRVLP